jgi:thiol:disulfide interchange protein DsbD
MTLLLLVSMAGPSFAAGDEQALLMPDQAFVISGKSLTAERLLVEWEVKDGYYLYRDKIHFDTDAMGIELGEPVLSKAKIKEDDFFGEVAIYRSRARAEIPIKRMPGAQDTLILRARSQGCADQGVCFPPHTQEIRLALLPMAQPRDAASKQYATESLPSFGGQAQTLFSDPGDTQLLDPKEAYQLSVTVEDSTHLRLYWSIAEGTYLYQDQIELSLLPTEGVALAQYDLPQAEIKKDSVRPDGSIGDVAIYHDEISLILPLARSTPEAQEITLEVAYQGCAEIGVCYPPITKRFTLSLPEFSAAQAQETLTSPPPASTANEPERSEADEIAKILEERSTLVIIGFFYLFGLGLAFTPCIYPMIPILSGIIAGQGDQITTHKAFRLSLVYVLGMAAAYTTAGVLAGIFGGNLQAYLQNPWILSSFALVFVLLALSMFGFYDLQLPSRLQSRLTEVSNRQKSGTLIGAGIMGLLSALIVGPCVAPPLAGALIYIGQTGEELLGGLALFAMSMGMGTPLVAIGTSAGKILPRAGSWMDTVKAVFGVIMLGVAIYLLQRILPTEVAMLLWGMLMIISGIYMGALQNLEIEASGWQKLWKGFGVVFIIYGSLMLVGVATGGKDTLQPLKGVTFAGGKDTTASHSSLTFQNIKSLEDLQQELAAASAKEQTVMLDFYADWCISCKEMEKFTFTDSKVIRALANTRLLQADVTAYDETDRKLMEEHFGLAGPPAIIFYGKDGQERKAYRVIGFKSADEFARHINKAFN